MIILKINMKIIQDYYSLILIVWCIKLKLKLPLMVLATAKKCLIFVIIGLSQTFAMIQTN